MEVTASFKAVLAWIESMSNSCRNVQRHRWER